MDSLPIIDENLIRIAFSVLSKETIRGPKKKGNNLKLYNNFNDFYNTTYKKLNYEIKINGINLSSIYNYIKKDILTNIENNIKLNFANYVNKFVNSSYAKSNEKLIEECQKGTKTAKGTFSKLFLIGILLYLYTKKNTSKQWRNKM